MRLIRYMLAFAFAMTVQAQHGFAQTATPEPLSGVAWQWQTEKLEDTSNYTVEFLPAGQLAVQADCNRGRASYGTFGENRLRIDTLALTRAACPPGSLEREFVERLVSGASYEFRGDKLALYPVAEPGTMVFTAISASSNSGGGAEATSGQGEQPDDVVLRAVGNEPGWLLEVTRNGDMRFSYNYGEQEVAVSAARIDEVEGGTSYYAVTESYALYAAVTEVACRDSMSGEAFGTTVTVALNAETFRGCGRDPR